MKFTHRQQAYIDKVQAGIPPNPVPSWARKVLRPTFMLTLLGLVWSHWFGAPKIVGDFAYAIMVLNVLLGFVVSIVSIAAVSVKNNRADEVDKLLFSPYSPIFYSKLKKAEYVAFFLGGFVILVAMGHVILAVSTLIAGMLVFLWHAVYTGDAKSRLASIDTENIEKTMGPKSF